VQHTGIRPTVEAIIWSLKTKAYTSTVPALLRRA